MLSMLFKVGADATGAERAMAAAAKKGEAAFKSMGKEITGRLAGMFTAGALIDGAGRFMTMMRDTADEIQDLSDQLEISTDEVQRLQVAADKAGVRFNVIAAAMRNIEDLRAAAATGDKRATGIFSTLGIDPTKGSALDIISAAVEASGRGAKEQAALFDMVGKKAGLIRNVIAEINKLGGIKLIDTDSLKAIDDATNQLKDLKREAIAASSDSVGWWARTLARARQIQDESTRGGKGSVGFGTAVNRSIAESLKDAILGRTEGGVDLSALPLPLRDPKTGKGGSGQMAAPPAAIPLALQSDALSRIGLFVGGRGDMGSQLVTIGNYQLSELRAIRATMEHANR